MKTVGDLSNEVSAILTGIDLNQVPDLYGSFERAVSTFIQKADIPEATGREMLMLYDGVYDYPASTRLFGSAVIDIAPQGVVRTPWDYAYKVPQAQFDRTKGFQYNGYNLTFQFVNGVSIMRVATPNVTPKVIIDPMNDTDGWTAGGTASNLNQDISVFYQQPASLRYTNGTGAGTLTKTLTSAIDIEIYEGVGVAFLALMIPAGTDPTTLTSVSVKLGSSSGNYAEVTETEGFLGAWVAGEFLLVAFDFAGATDTGTPDWSAIDYVQVTTTTSASVTNMRVGSLFIALPSATNVSFYSPAVFQNGTDTPSAEISADTDTILFRDASYNIYVQEAAREVAKNQGGDISSGIIQSIDLVLEGNGRDKLGLYQQFRGDNPSDQIRTVGNYYLGEQG